MPPRVSVIIPCYNAARTLPWALASLVAQSYKHWECLIVDDGSTDQSSEIVDRLREPRIRLIRLSRNRGRGFARQVALDEIRGDLCCFLDADDWLFPSKLMTQAKAMDENPDLSLVATGMSIVDSENNLVGVRSRGLVLPGMAILGPITHLAPPPVAFPPCMIRSDLARSAGFDPKYPTCEDTDFLIRLLMGRRYGLLPDVSYVYGEYNSVTLEKIVHALRYSRRLYGAYCGRYPIRSCWNMSLAIAKEAVYRGAFTVGMGRLLIERRSVQPSAEDRSGFLSARCVVRDLVLQLFPEPADGSQPSRVPAALPPESISGLIS